MKRVFAEYLISRGLIAGTSLEGIPDLNWNSSEPIGRLALLHNLLEPSSIDEVLERQRTARHLFASFHLMQIQQVIGGVGGDPRAQAIQHVRRSSDHQIRSQPRWRCSH